MKSNDTMVIDGESCGFCSFFPHDYNTDQWLVDVTSERITDGRNWGRSKPVNGHWWWLVGYHEWFCKWWININDW